MEVGGCVMCLLYDNCYDYLRSCLPLWRWADVSIVCYMIIVMIILVAVCPCGGGGCVMCLLYDNCYDYLRICLPLWRWADV